MKTTTMLSIAFCLFLPVMAQDAVTVEAKFIEHPADLVISKETWQRGEVLKHRGVNVLCAQAVTTTGDRPASIKAVDLHAVPSGGTPTDHGSWQRKVETGHELQVQLTLRGEIIDFSGTATIRQFNGVKPAGDVVVSQFTSREFYFGGTTKNGEALVLPSMVISEDKQLTVVLIFTKT